MIKKIFLIFLIIVLISSPIIVLGVTLVNTFWGPIYKLEVNSSNIKAIEELLYKDNIEIENLNNVTRIELCGQGLWDYNSLDFYYSGSKIKSVNLYHNQDYYIDEYLANNTFSYDEIFNISIYVSLLTIGVTIYTSRKRKIKIEK